MYVSRMLSFVGCSFEKKDCVLNEADKALYDEAAYWWMKLHQGFEECERYAAAAQQQQLSTSAAPQHALTLSPSSFPHTG